MASPLTIGITSSFVAVFNRRRSIIRFQNTGASTIYIKKVPFEGVFTPPSVTDYEVVLTPSTTTAFEAGDAFETNSIAGFMAVSSVVGGLLSIYETNKV